VSVQDRALGSLANTQLGDCIVCFNKNDIYNVSKKINVCHDRALGSLANTQPGNCIVCFNKNNIYNVSRNLEFIKKNKFLFRIERWVAWGTPSRGTASCASTKTTSTTCP
jgi:hypothetical protein